MPTDPKTQELYEQYSLSDAIIDGDRVYLSGIVAKLRQGETDQQVAFDRAFKAIEDVLKRSGSSWDDVLEITSYHTDWPAQKEAFLAVKRRYLKVPYPAWTSIDIDRLNPDNALAEIRVIARRSDKKTK